MGRTGTDFFKFSVHAYTHIHAHTHTYTQSFWQTLVAEDAVDVLQWAKAVCTDKLVICYLHDVKV